MKIADRFAIAPRTMRAVDLPHQGLLDVADLCGNNLQLAVHNVTTLAAEMHHHHVPPLISIVLPLVPFELLESLLGVVNMNGEVVQCFAVAVVEFVDPLGATLQILNPLLNLYNGNIKGTMVDSLIFKSSLNRQHLLLEFLDPCILASKLLSLQPVLVSQMTHSALQTFGLGALSRDIVGHLHHLLLQGQELLGMTIFMMG